MIQDDSKNKATGEIRRGRPASRPRQGLIDWARERDRFCARDVASAFGLSLPTTCKLLAELTQSGAIDRRAPASMPHAKRPVETYAAAGRAPALDQALRTWGMLSAG